MKCYNCGSEIEKGAYCPKCRTDNTPYIMIMDESNRLYNEGLSLTKIRDLSGAVDRLNRSLRYNKANTAARNLLGLVYFETGETVMAIDEWVISKNLCPENNDADRYLHSIEYGQGMVEQLDRINKKYNLALSYCREKNFDLAEIQLRRVISDNPKMIRARQLLSLLYIQDKNFEGAMKEINAAIKIDASNPITIRYQLEVREKIKEKNKEKKNKSETLYIQDGNDTVLMPRQGFFAVLDNQKGGILNVIIGLALGLLISIFLIIPTIRQKENSTNASALISANQDVKNNETNISTLQNEVDELNEKLSNYEGKGDIKTSYEKLIEAWNCANNEDIENESAALSVVNRDLLDANGKTVYDTLSTAVTAANNEKAYQDGISALDSKDYAAAITSFNTVVSTDENYNEGNAMYYLAFAYEKNGDSQNAITWYDKVASAYSGKKIGRNAKRRSTNLSNGETNDDINPTTSNNENTNNSNQNSNSNQENNSSLDGAAGDNGNTNTQVQQGDTTVTDATTQPEATAQPNASQPIDPGTVNPQ